MVYPLLEYVPCDHKLHPGQAAALPGYGRCTCIQRRITLGLCWGLATGISGASKRSVKFLFGSGFGLTDLPPLSLFVIPQLDNVKLSERSTRVISMVNVDVL